MKASQILIQADPTIQTRNTYTIRWDHIKKKADLYCAMGLLGCKTDSMTAGGLIAPSLEDLFIDNFGANKDLMRKLVKCPEGDCDISDTVSRHHYTGSIGWAIIHLNDHHRWSFKQIGTWLKGFGL